MCAANDYTSIGEKCDSPANQTYYYMMNNLLYSRMECGFPSNNDYFDEDVNVYLANLLSSIINPEYNMMLNKYLAPYDIPLFERISSIENPRLKYSIYKANADFLLISIGIFNNPKRMRPRSAGHMQIPGKSYIGRGKAYYKLAQSYSQETFRRMTAIGDVLGKLAGGFEKYSKVLSLMRSEYFNMYRKITSGEMFHLEQSIGLIEKKGALNSLYDKFLDAYSNHRRAKNPKSKKLLDEISAEIRSLDPSFRFSPE